MGVKHLTVVQNHIIYFEETGESFTVSEVMDEEGKTLFIKPHNGTFHYLESLKSWEKLTGGYMGSTYQEAVQAIVRYYRRQLDDPVVSKTPEFKAIVEKLEKEYL